MDEEHDEEHEQEEDGVEPDAKRGRYEDWEESRYNLSASAVQAERTPSCLEELPACIANTHAKTYTIDQATCKASLYCGRVLSENFLAVSFLHS